MRDRVVSVAGRVQWVGGARLDSILGSGAKGRFGRGLNGRARAARAAYDALSDVGKFPEAALRRPRRGLRFSPLLPGRNEPRRREESGLGKTQEERYLCRILE